MATTGTTAFNLDFSDIAEEAWERAGKEMRTGYDLRTARRSMNLMLLEWQSRGINMWTIDEGEVALVAGTATYDLPADTIDLLDHVIRTGSGNAATQADLTITRISVSTYSSIPNKLVSGRPTQLWIQRLRDAPRVTIWPVPDTSTPYVLRYWRIRRIQDAGNGAETADVQYRFLPALVAGLAYHLAVKSPDMMARVPMLQAMYNEAFENAASEDREKASLRVVPRQQFIR